MCKHCSFDTTEYCMCKCFLLYSIKCLVYVPVLFILHLPPTVILSLDDEHILNLACKLCYQFIAFTPTFV